ncbi:hypothetical protein [Wenyingzhuangia marina]|uniref:Lipoprotein n=1 Tax=Wenyingzhuangia marina TaxID=1195760 RepID=A0A1M5V6Q9_9FLAO|nr:hypothetical protein [Wenyingzhuangia marina]SHH70906.1 hypothetical protein SAMN05444281_1556 [Wenyingzhuangia marina]
MRYKISFCILFILVSCKVQRIATTSKPMLFKIESDTKFSDNHEVSVDYKGIYNQNYQFEVIIRNKTKDSIFVNPASFKYSLISEKNGTDSLFIHVINPEEKIEQLVIHEDVLKNEKNPYSLADKSIKEIATEGFISGIIGLVFGQNGEELESIRQKNEDDWEQEHSLQLNKANEELYFWNNNALLPCTIPPKNEVFGKILFPVSLNTNEINIKISIQNDVYNFTFKQKN